MKYLFYISLLFVNNNLFAQDTTGLKQAMESLNQALLSNDSSGVKLLVVKEIAYGHSNGWMQSKQEMVNDMFNGKLQYKKIEVSEESFTINKEAIAVTSKTIVDGVLNKTINFSLNLRVMQVWKKVKNGWVLIARQSVKVG